MGCSWHPTVLSPPLGWVAATIDTYPESHCSVWDQGTRYPGDLIGFPQAPPWAGEPRGLFAFHPSTRPSKLWWNRASVEAELGRSLPAADPATGRFDDHVHYWYQFPQLFHVRNQSGDTLFLNTRLSDVRCGAVFVEVEDGQEVEIGPWWGRGAGALAIQLLSPTAVYVSGTGSLIPSVLPGVDVRVTTPSRADPGLTPYLDACAAPAVVVV